MTFSRFTAITASFAVALVFGSGSAAGALITFEGHGDDGSSPLFEAGFTFTFSAQGWGVFTDGFVGGGAPYTHNGTTRLVMSGGLNGRPCSVTINPTDNSQFSIVSFDAATFFPGFTGGTVVTGNLHGGGTVTTTVSLADTFAHYTLPGTFVNLDNVVFTNTLSGDYRADSGVSLDNLQMGPVPEPASLAVLGLACTGFLKRRRRKSSR
jgi:hypothetical protein